MKWSKYFVQAFVLVSALSSLAKAAEDNVVVAPKPVVYEDSSEFHRMSKKVTVTVQPFGIGPNYAVSQGLAAGLFLNRNSVVSLEYMANTSNNTNYGSYGWNYDIKTSAIGAHLKQYVGNSFYVKGGVDYRTVEYRYSYTSGIGSEFDENYSFSGRSWAASIAIGNQWQYQDLTFGFDWVGVVVPFASNVSNERYSSRWIYSNDIRKRDSDLFVKNTILQALRFHIGMSF